MIFALVLAIPQPPVDTLAAALERLYWNSAMRGPLLIVAPECYTLLRKPDEPPPDIFRFSQGGEPADDEEPSSALPAAQNLPPRPLNPTVFFPRFGLQTIKLSGLTVAEPTRMHVPQTISLTEAQQEGSANPYDTLMRFLATLTESQWKAIGSAEGLGVGLLESKAQKKLFQQLLPARTVAFFPTEPSFPKDYENPTRLPDTALADPHLRIFKTISVGAIGQGQESETLSLRDRENTDPEGKLRRYVLLSPEKDVPEEVLEPFGLAPTRLKPTQLDPASAALNPLISLEGATTVGELVGRIARATRLNLLCDSRVAGRSVAIRGRGMVRAGTVLAGLCRGLQGAVRKLDSTYLLTAQVATNIELNEAVQLASDGINKQMSQRYTAEAAEALQARGQLIRSRAIENVPRDSRSLASEALWKLGEKYHPNRSLEDEENDEEDKGTRNPPESVPLASLPAFFQQQVQTSYQKRRAESEKLGETVRPAPTHATAQVYLSVEALLPSLGRARARVTTFPLDRLHPDTPLPQPPPPVRWPKTGVRGWYVPLPADDQESEALITLAKACGVTELRIALPPGTDSEKRLALLAVKLKAARLSLVPVLCPFEAATAETKRDIDLLGRTAKEWSRTPVAVAASALEPLKLRDYAEPEAIDLAAFTASCLRLTSLPGVTALALAELAPPGYGSETAPWSGGGQRAERLAFLQKEKLDPADVEQEDDTSAPEEQARWWQRKEARRDAFLLRLDVALKAARLPVPISAEGNFGWERWRHTIMKPTNHSEEPARPPREAHPLLMAIALTDSSWKVSNSSPGALLDETGQRRLRLQKYMDAISNPGEEIPYDGIVLDISALPLVQGLKLLESAFQDKPKPVPAD